MDSKHQKSNNQQSAIKKNDEKKEHVTEINGEVEMLKQEVTDMKSKYLRALADYQNLEKRFHGERMIIREDVTFQLILRLLPFLDNLEQAEIFIKDKGLDMIRKQYYQQLTEMGIEEIKVLGKEFDPHIAEAIDVVEGEKDNVIVEVLRKGYKYKEKILRPAQVKVSKKVQSVN